VEKLIKEWENCQKFTIFEIEVIDKRTGKQDWLTFDVELREGKFRSQHEPLSQKQVDSPYIASTWTDIDPDFSLDENLQAHYDDCQQAIIDSEFYSLYSEED
jgi:hypothetical protein